MDVGKTVCKRDRLGIDTNIEWEWNEWRTKYQTGDWKGGGKVEYKWLGGNNVKKFGL